MKLNPADLRIETFRTADAGPKMRPSIKRIIHIPTGLTVECFDYPRSETDKAIERLEKMVEDCSKPNKSNSKGVKLYAADALRPWLASIADKVKTDEKDGC